MTILELLKESTPSWIQGHHTRIFAYSSGMFAVVGIDPTGFSVVYDHCLYWGKSEEKKAVAVFVGHENT